MKDANHSVWRDTHTDRQTDTHTHRQTDRQTDLTEVNKEGRQFGRLLSKLYSTYRRL